jgi:hypothetical protein
MSIILCIKNYNFSAKYERKTSSCPITSACPITKPKVYIVYTYKLNIYKWKISIVNDNLKLNAVKAY